MQAKEAGFTALEVPGAYAKHRLSCSPVIHVTMRAPVEIKPTSFKQPTQTLASRPKTTGRQNYPPSHSNRLPGFVLMEELHLLPGMARTRLVSPWAFVSLPSSEERCLGDTKTTPPPYRNMRR